MKTNLKVTIKGRVHSLCSAAQARLVDPFDATASVGFLPHFTTGLAGAMGIEFVEAASD